MNTGEEIARFLGTLTLDDVLVFEGEAGDGTVRWTVARPNAGRWFG